MVSMNQIQTVTNFCLNFISDPLELTKQIFDEMVYNVLLENNVNKVIQVCRYQHDSVK
jgi:hypothetical protein